MQKGREPIKETDKLQRAVIQSAKELKMNYSQMQIKLVLL